MQIANLPVPFNDDVVLVEKPRENISSGGLFLPETRFGDEKLSEGTVVAVGPGNQYPDGTRSPMQVLPGDQVLFSRMAGIEIKYESGAYLVLSQKSVLAILGEVQHDETAD